MEKRPTHLITSGFSSTILLFKEYDDGGFEKKILHEEEDNSNYSFMVRNKNLPGIFYVVHELEDFDGEKTGAISRWQLHDDKTFTKHEVFKSGGCEPTHLEFDTKRNLLYVANYGVNLNGSFSAFKVDMKDGTILERIYMNHLMQEVMLYLTVKNKHIPMLSIFTRTTSTSLIWDQTRFGNTKLMIKVP